MTLTLSLLSVCPRVRKVNDTFVLTTGFKSAILTAGLSLRRVEVDPAARTIRIASRVGWFFARERAVPFHRVRAVTYGYADHSPTKWLSDTYNSFDVYRVGLRLHDDEEIHLFRFAGEGAWVNDSIWPDWVYWDEKVGDLAGTQDRESLAAVEVLSALIGVNVRHPK